MINKQRAESSLRAYPGLLKANNLRVRILVTIGLQKEIGPAITSLLVGTENINRKMDSASKAALLKEGLIQ